MEVGPRQVDAAAAVLWHRESALHRDVDWPGADEDEREPYRRMARLMLEAAAATASACC